MAKRLELTDSEREEVVKRAIIQAEFNKGQAEYNRLRSVETYATLDYPKFSPAEFLQFIERLGQARSVEKMWSSEFSIDDDNRAIVKLLALYFTNDPRFVKGGDGYSLSKGILLTGDVGCGKTVLVDLCRINPKASYSYHDCSKVVLEYQDKGPETITRYASNFRIDAGRQYYHFGQKEYGRFFDDLGAEGLVKHYGTDRNVMAEILFQRYHNHPYYLTHCTSNMTLDQLAPMYGARVIDRIREMFNVIEFPPSAKSRRR